MSAAPSRTARIAVLAATLGLAALVPASADAAVYYVQQCHSETANRTDGFTAETHGAFTYVSTACGPGGYIGGGFDPAVAHANEDRAYVGFTAPSGTSLDSITAARDARAGGSQPYGTPVAHLFTQSGVHDAYSAFSGVPTAGGTLNLDLGGAPAITWGAVCSGGNGCVPGDTRYTLRDITFGLRDENIPTLSQVAGSLRSSSAIDRIRTLTYAATDAGGGVFQQRLIIDGTPRAPEIVDPNGGKCAKPFSARVPCQREVTASATLDTSALADGPHEVALDVRDVTEANKAIHGPWTILVDNVPPTLAAPTLSGTAREGDSLICAAATTGQTPKLSFQWIRTQADGGDAAAIPEATGATYVVTAADIGRKLVCRVTATDGGGSTVRESTITQAPFDGGRTVAPYCADRPTGSLDECGDLDGDGVENRADTDRDGDGIPNGSDVAADDPARPASSSPVGTSAAGGSAGATPTSGGVTGASNNIRFLLSSSSTTVVRRRVGWRRSAFALSGRLTDATGQSLAGLKLHITQTVNGRTVILGETTSGRDGSWTFRVPRGPSRTITVTAGDGVNAAKTTVQQRVVALVSFRAMNKRLRRGGRVLFRGTLHGGYVNTREKLVEFQVYYRGAWRTIATLKTDRKGRFAVRYRFGPAAVGTYAFRVRTLPTDGYPFAVGKSGGKSAKVRVG